MTVQRERFEADPARGMMAGVCAGLSRHFGIDVTLIRVGAVLVTLLGAFPWTVFAYLAAAWFGRPGRGEQRPDTYEAFEADEPASERIRDLRMKAMAASESNDRLAREIEALRHERAPSS
ncbi:MAG: PspC domain-containing protein [Sphingosinicella sp.]